MPSADAGHGAIDAGFSGVEHRRSARGQRVGACVRWGFGHGWGLPSLAQVNRFPAYFDPVWHPATGLIVGHDVVGGVFALNGGDPAAAGGLGHLGR